MLHTRILKHEAQRFAVLKNSQVLLLLLIQELHFEDHCLVQCELNQTLHSKESGGSSPQWTSNWTVPPESSFPHSSVGKEFACNAGDPSLIPGSGRSPGEGIGYPLQCSWASLVAQLVKDSACNAGDLGSIPGFGRSSGEGKGYPLQYSGLENSTDCIVHGVAKSKTGLSNFHFPFL